MDSWGFLRIVDKDAHSEEEVRNDLIQSSQGGLQGSDLSVVCSSVKSFCKIMPMEFSSSLYLGLN